MVVTEKEQEIVQTIEKLKKQLDYHCQNCQSAHHSEFLEQAIDDLQQQLNQLQNRPAYVGVGS
jgi:uncharacterized coiled-coil DUF342 family protein